jgi:CPSF A subunit region
VRVPLTCAAAEHHDYRTETQRGLHGCPRVTSSLGYVRRFRAGDNLFTLHPAAADGSLYEIIPIEDEVYKRLQLLQGQLSRNVQQVAGLNPKAFRYEPSRAGGGRQRMTH